MDREVKELYQVLIQAKDMGGQLGGLAGTTTINITLSDVNDNPPRFSKSKSLCNCLTANLWKLQARNHSEVLYMVYLKYTCLFFKGVLFSIHAKEFNTVEHKPYYSFFNLMIFAKKN